MRPRFRHRSVAPFAIALLIQLVALSTRTAPQPAAPECAGNDVLTELVTNDPAGHARILAAAAVVPNGKGVLWRIDRRGLAPSWLLGTLNASDGRLHQLTPAIKEAVAGAKRMAFEVADLSDDAFGQALMRLGTLGTYGRGQSLKNDLPPADYEALQAILKKRRIPAGAFDGMRPWMISLKLALPACEQLRQSAGHLALGKLLAAEGKARGIPLVGLETFDSQLKAMAGMSLLTELGLLVGVVSTAERNEDVHETLVLRYLARDIDLFWPLLRYFHEKAGLPPATADELELVLNTRRNHGMSNVALQLLTEGGVLIAVNALHLPGKEGLVELFRQAGYTLTRVD